MDLGAGKGQDLHKYIQLNVKNVLFIDENINNLCELVDRKYEISKSTTCINII